MNHPHKVFKVFGYGQTIEIFFDRIHSKTIGGLQAPQIEVKGNG
jgi:hypothetical protein